MIQLHAGETMHKLLLTGANGYIGRRLKHVLMTDPNLHIRLMVRNSASLRLQNSSNLEIVSADVTHPESLDQALQGIDTAYYLIHGLNHGDFRERDRESAQNFLDACIRQKVKTIIY